MLTSDSLDISIHKLHVRLQLAKRPISGACGLGLVTKPVFCSQLIPVKINSFEHLERAQKLLEESDAVDTAVRRLNFLKFGIATQT